jgi:hypothetical protein
MEELKVLDQPMFYPMWAIFGGCLGYVFWNVMLFGTDFNRWWNPFKGK